ncbi:MAG TPA: Hsp20 family protein, partial [Anaerolineales bacterium]|nr:Hsp20 family protein [Anaerolineales bacterium]
MMTFYVSPYRRVARMRDVMNRLLEETVAEQEPAEREMSLAVDVQAEDEAYVLSALVPGLEAEDINVEVLNNTVTIRGEFKDHTQADARYLISELPA